MNIPCHITRIFFNMKFFLPQHIYIHLYICTKQGFSNHVMDIGGDIGGDGCLISSLNYSIKSNLHKIILN